MSSRVTHYVCKTHKIQENIKMGKKSVLSILKRLFIMFKTDIFNVLISSSFFFFFFFVFFYRHNALHWNYTHLEFITSSLCACEHDDSE